MHSRAINRTGLCFVCFLTVRFDMLCNLDGLLVECLIYVLEKDLSCCLKCGIIGCKLDIFRN